MVVKMMRWRPWPPLISRKYEVNLKVLRFEGFDWVDEGVESSNGGVSVEIRWKGPKISFRRSVKRNCTKEVKLDVQNGGVLVDWDEDFQSVCSLSGYKDNVFHYWEINFSVLHGLNQGTKNKTSVVGSASLNLAEYASKIEGEVIEIKIPLTVPSIAVERRPLLTISLGLMELRAAAQESMELIQSPIIPLSPRAASIETSSEKDEVFALKAGLRKVKMFTDYVSIERAKKAYREEGSS